MRQTKSPKELFLSFPILHLIVPCKKNKPHQELCQGRYTETTTEIPWQGCTYLLLTHEKTQVNDHYHSMYMIVHNEIITW